MRFVYKDEGDRLLCLSLCACVNEGTLSPIHICIIYRLIFHQLLRLIYCFQVICFGVFCISAVEASVDCCCINMKVFS